MWLLVVCDIVWTFGVAIPAMRVEMGYPSREVCDAAQKGAADEGQYALECLDTTKYDRVAEKWASCGQKYFLLMQPEQGGAY